MYFSQLLYSFGSKSACVAVHVHENILAEPFYISVSPVISASVPLCAVVPSSQAGLLL